VTMRLSRCHRVLGVKVKQEDVSQTFTRLGFEFTVQGDNFVVLPPSYRFDIRIEEDLIEEVARIIGFESIPAVPPVAAAQMITMPETTRSAHTVRHEIAALDYQEVINFSFVEQSWETDMLGHADPIRLLNPIASQLAVMRSSLLPGLVANIRYNANRKQARVRVFELGRVFRRANEVADGPLTVAGVDQPQALAGAAWGPATEDQWGLKSRAVDFFDVKRDLEVLFSAQAKQLRFVPAQHALLHPGRSARIELGNVAIGWLGELHPQWAQEQELTSAPVLFEVSLGSLAALPMPSLQELSRQPMVQRDLAIWVSADKSVQALLDTIYQTIAADPLLAVVQHVGLFDLWRDPAKVEANEKSLAFRVSLQDTDSTLDEAQVDLCMTKIRAALESAHHARSR
jgi:phenylalanyl-tRNA synthetase beta chain